MLNLRQRLAQTDRFLIGCELVSVRGSMAERNGLKTRAFASDLVGHPDVDWVSITDNAGGNPQLAPAALGKPLLYAGQEVVIHLTCKDLNRNGLESEAWLLHSEGFNNLLAMTGDYPVSGNAGSAKPVFDLDSVGLISLLAAMNQGLDPLPDRTGRRRPRFDPTSFLIGAVTTNFKLREGELLPQYHKLAAKIRAGAHFIVNQIGFDARKMSEQIAWMRCNGLSDTPLIGNVYLLNPRVAHIFHAELIPGVVVSDALRDRCDREAASADQGRAFFIDLAARQLAVYRGLGYRGAYLGGVHDITTVNTILDREKTFAPDDWKQFAREFQYARPGEYFAYGHDPATGLSDPATPGAPDSQPARHVTLHYQLSKFAHRALFTPGHLLNDLGTRLCARSANPRQGPAVLRWTEHLSKSLLYSCRDCGDCSLPEIGYLCPESQCAKNQRNGPCGGTRGGRCEVDGFGDCIWLRAYERAKADGTAANLLAHTPVTQDQSLRGTSAWANYWLKKDHTFTHSPKPP